MSAELVLSRGCHHTDWCAVPGTSIECCCSCGYTLVLGPSGRLPVDVYADVQIQPRPRDTFNTGPVPPLDTHVYTYRPLDYSQGRQIRVLNLKAGAASDPLQCELEHVDLQHGPVYEALSYTWANQEGDDSLCSTICCCGGSEGDALIPITSNCESALRYYRSPEEDRRLWVDAICIDQANVGERNHQVKNMLAIFRTAVRVLVYLGDEDSSLGRLLEYITSDADDHLPRTADFMSLFKCRWFHRVWVLQEVAVAKSILVRYGASQITWTDLVQQGNLFISIMANKRIPLVLPPVVSYALAQTNTGSRHLGEKSDLLTLLHVSRNCSCKDPRDKVYAITGLLMEESKLPLTADYSASTTAGWVFLQAAAWHIGSTKSLEILSLVDGKSDLKMPSWVPDWTRKSPSPLPAQFKTTKASSPPRITSQDGSLLPLLSLKNGTTNYPLDCALVVTGRKLGPIWTDKVIFGSRTVGYPMDLRTRNYTWIRDNVSHLKAPHWLHRPSPVTGYCPATLNIWARLLLLYSHATTTAAEKVLAGTITVIADIPPAFGGPCQNCAMIDFMLLQDDEHYDSSKARLLAQKKTICDDDKIEEFMSTMYQHGTNRRIFATDHSLGLGPVDARNWDEVWLLEGATVPFVLRREKGHYKLIGACYVYGADRNVDRCACCACDRTREFMVSTEKKSADSHTVIIVPESTDDQRREASQQIEIR